MTVLQTMDRLTKSMKSYFRKTLMLKMINDILNTIETDLE